MARSKERYGYQSDTGFDGTAGNEGGGTSIGIAGADYSVPAYVDARRRFQLIDNWWNEHLTSDAGGQPFILRDGERILERWLAVAKSDSDRGIRLAVQVAADELRLRIRKLRIRKLA